MQEPKSGILIFLPQTNHYKPLKDAIGWIDYRLKHDARLEASQNNLSRR